MYIYIYIHTHIVPAFVVVPTGNPPSSQSLRFSAHGTSELDTGSMSSSSGFRLPLWTSLIGDMGDVFSFVEYTIVGSARGERSSWTIFVRRCNSATRANSSTTSVCT